jgi:two-component system, OmpR family, sensor histidine kinase TctE
MVARFFEWMLAPLVFVWLVSFGATFVAARASADKTHDVRLLSIAKLLDTEWQDAKKRGIPNQFPSLDSRRWLSYSSASPFRYAIVNKEWRIVSGDDELAEASKDLIFATSSPGRVEQSNLLIDAVLYRTVKYNVNTNESIVLAQNRDEDDALIRRIMLFEAIPQALILLMAGFLVAYGLAYVTKPLAQIQGLLEERSSNRLEPITNSKIPQELEPFLEGVNSLLRRLEVAMSSQRRFIADAAHQLRTPIAAMLTESQLLSKLSSPAELKASITRLNAISERTSRLTTQLLSLARAESSTVISTFETVDICSLAQLIAIDTAPTALSKDIDFAFEQQQDSWLYRADPTLIGEVVRNLIDNALCYTPKGGQVVLNINPLAKQISIDDSGPGILKSDRANVLKPFFRGSNLALNNRTSGSGLGLAIIDEVAKLHDAKVFIDDSVLGGARIVVSFR